MILFRFLYLPEITTLSVRYDAFSVLTGMIFAIKKFAAKKALYLYSGKQSQEIYLKRMYTGDFVGLTLRPLPILCKRF